MNATLLRSTAMEPHPSAEAGKLGGHILNYLRDHQKPAWSLLIEGSEPDSVDAVTIQDLNDLLYSLYFLGWPVEPGQKGAEAYARFLGTTSLAGGLNVSSSEQRLSVHGTAYALSTLALLKQRGADLFNDVVTAEEWRLDELIDPSSLRPKWPSKWSHHNWRVSHWVGGSVSILNELARHMPTAYQANQGPEVNKALAACDDLIDERSGVLKCYKSRLVQFAFRQAYRLRHDPMLGDIGGVVHVHWVNYANNRAYKSGERLFDLAADAMLKHQPFMEAMPYCLDFDIVQIVRTSMPETAPPARREALKSRARTYASDILSFLENRLDETYALHKLPGALATLHECALIDGSISLTELGRVNDSKSWPKDIMSEVSWL